MSILRKFRTQTALGCGVVLFCSVLAAQMPNSSATQNTRVTPGVPPLMLGAAWYPEQWPEMRWETDLALMENAHLQFVRVGEFAWSTLEPSEGKYDLDWLERAINLAGKHGIYTVIGTPTATPPAWLTTKYPEVLRVDEDGRRDEHGNRQQSNWSNPKYRVLCRGIVEKLTAKFGHNPYVIGWQLDNEIAQTSADEGSQAQFQSWLKTRYGSLEELNRRWTTSYWSESYTDWSQVPIPKHGGVDSGNPGLLLCWRLFISDTWRDFLRNQIDVIRSQADARQFITTNTMGFFEYYDHYVTEKELDLAAWDDYMPNGSIDPVYNGMAHDLTRGFKRKNFWIMETQPGFVNWSSVNVSLPKDGERALVWHDIAHGADAVSFWQWRSALNGQEQYHGTLIGADGSPVPLYSEVKEVGDELAKASAAVADTTVESQVAILQSYESRWAIGWQPQTENFDPLAEMARYYKPLRNRTQAIDIVAPGVDLSQYKLVVAPAMNLLTEQESENLIAYVKAGGNLVLGPRSGMKDGDNSLQTNRQPGLLVPMLGGRVEQFYALNGPVSVEGDFGNTEATIWAELLSTSSPDAKVTMRYGKSNGWLDGQPAVISRKVGNGSITYIGTVFDEKTMLMFADHWLTQAKVELPNLKVPDGVEASVRRGKGKVIHILVNLSGKEQTVHLPVDMQDELQGVASPHDILLPIYGVAVFSENH